ncbi:MAG: hypothetical protein AAB903_03910 [Patescibacteria group bacterium]
MRVVSKNVTDLGSGQKIEVTVYNDGMVHIAGAVKVLCEMRYLSLKDGILILDDQSSHDGTIRIVTEKQSSGAVHIDVHCDDRYAWYQSPQLTIGTRVNFERGRERDFEISAGRKESGERHILFSEPYRPRKVA